MHCLSTAAQPPEAPEIMPSRTTLRETAQETLNVASSLEKQLRSRKLQSSARYTFESLSRLNPNDCPLHPRPATIRVVNEDTLNAAMRLLESARANAGDLSSRENRPVIVNFASHKNPGGGWLNGAVGQEEAIFYRSSLALSLKKTYYPLKMDEAVYSPHVLVFRGDMASGHHLLVPQTPVVDLPLLSVMSVAAINKPKVQRFVVKTKGLGSPQSASSTSNAHDKYVFARDKDRGITKAKMRLTLRMAAVNGHRSLVLGALGCGAFHNPAEDVAHCWLEVLKEDEFAVNWWKDVCFAVSDPKTNGNFEIFKRVLDGKKV